MNDDGERALRVHLRNLLVDYCLTHLTRDYVVYTESLIAEVLSEHFRLLPAYDLTVPTLPTEPFDDLSKLFNLTQLALPEEKLSLFREHVQYIRRSLSGSSCSVEPKCFWGVDALDNFKRGWKLCRQMPPLLIPTPGLADMSPKLPTALPKIIETFSITRVQPDSETNSLADLETVLNLRIAVQPETRAGMLSLMKSNPYYTSRLESNPIPENSFVQSFLARRTPRYVPAVRCESPPLFPRTPSTKGPESLAHAIGPLPKVKDMENADMETEMHLRHMAIANVSGWNAYIPSSPALSSCSSESQVDELISLSSPNTEPLLVQNFASAKMDDVLMPRNERHGNGNKIPTLTGVAPSLFSHLAPLKRIGPASISHVQIPRGPSPQPSLSILGIPVTSSVEEFDELDTTDDFDATLSSLYNRVRTDDIGAPIIREMIEAKDNIWMDVPRLLLNHELPSRATLLPSLYAQLVQVAASQPQLEGNPVPACIPQTQGLLKQVKGVKPLNLELSWTPFSFGAVKPTYEDVLGLSQFIHGILRQPEDTLVARLLEVTLTQLEPCDDDGVVPNFPMSMGQQRAQSLCDRFGRHDADEEILLTRAERRRVARLPEVLTDEDMFSDTDSDEDVPPALKRPRLDNNWEASPVGPLASTSQPEAQAHRSCSLVHIDAGDENEENVCLNQEFCDFDAFPLGIEVGSLENSEFEPLVDLYSGFARTHANYPDVFLCNNSRSPHVFQEDEPAVPTCSISSLLGDTDEPSTKAFGALSFDSRFSSAVCLSPPTHPMDIDPEPATLVHEYLGTEPQHGLFETEQTIDLVLPNPSVADFVSLRGKNIRKAISELASPAKTFNVSPEIIADPVPSALPSVPEEFFNTETLRLPSEPIFPSTPHTYLASLDLIQKQMIIRSLRSPHYLVSLVEHETLGGVDLVLDPYTAVILTPLISLPMDCGNLCSRLEQQSWRYSSLLLVFEAYPSQHWYRRPANDVLSPSAFTPPILKAWRKLRTDLSVAKAYESVCTTTKICFAFARTVDETAIFVRAFGDQVESRNRSERMEWSGSNGDLT